MMQEKTCATEVSTVLMKNLKENLLRTCHQHAAAENPGPLWVEDMAYHYIYSPRVRRLYAGHTSIREKFPLQGRPSPTRSRHLRYDLTRERPANVPDSQQGYRQHQHHCI